MKLVERQSDWLSRLPFVGYGINVLLLSGESFEASYGRVMRDRQVIHLGLIEKLGEGQFPVIAATIEIPVGRILMIAYQDDFGERQTL